MGVDCSADAQALFNLKEILLSVKEAFRNITNILWDSRKEDIRNFLNYQMTEVDSSLSNPRKPSHWDDFKLAITPWLSDDSWDTVITQIDLWHKELGKTGEFRSAVFWIKVI